MATVVFPDPATPCTIMLWYGERRMISFCSFWIVAMISPRTACLFFSFYLVSRSSLVTTSES